MTSSGVRVRPQVPRCEIQMAHLAPVSTRAHQEHGFQEIIFFGTSATTSGVALTCCLILLSFTARAQARSRHFDRFIHVHNVVFVLWPLLLSVHGAAGMSGVGLPLVLFVWGLPVCLYLRDRVVHLLRYCFFAGKAVVIEHAVVREGQRSPLLGSLLYLRTRSHPLSGSRSTTCTLSCAFPRTPGCSGTHSRFARNEQCNCGFHKFQVLVTGREHSHRLASMRERLRSSLSRPLTDRIQHRPCRH